MVQMNQVGFQKPLVIAGVAYSGLFRAIPQAQTTPVITRAEPHRWSLAPVTLPAILHNPGNGRNSLFRTLTTSMEKRLQELRRAMTEVAQDTASIRAEMAEGLASLRSEETAHVNQAWVPMPG